MDCHWCASKCSSQMEKRRLGQEMTRPIINDEKLEQIEIFRTSESEIRSKENLDNLGLKLINNLTSIWHCEDMHLKNHQKKLRKKLRKQVLLFEAFSSSLVGNLKGSKEVGDSTMVI